MRFTALKTFWSEETQSEYVEGMSYTLRPGNDKLAALLPTWQAEGKVAPGVLDADAVGFVRGEG